MDRVPVTVLTGFLGAGKTTLLNRFLADPALAGAAVIVNEFGEIGIDHQLVEWVDGDMLMLTTGCLCCVARGDLVAALESLVERRAEGRVAFDRIVIETTGLAEPGPVLNALLPRPGFDACRLDTLIAVVDAVGGMGMIHAAEEAARQVAMADVIVLSKMDLLPPGDETLDDVTRDLRTLNASAPIVPATDFASLSALVAGVDAHARSAHDGAGGHSHQHLRDIETVVLRAGALDPRRFELFLERAVSRHGGGLLRLKGFLATHAAPERPTLINVVQHRIHPASLLAAWPDADRSTRLVVIARTPSAQEIALLWDDVFGPPRIDRPDAAALIGDAGPGLF